MGKFKVCVSTARVIVSFGLLYFCIFQVDIKAVSGFLAQADLSMIGLAVVWVLLQIAVGAKRFKILLQPIKALSYAQHFKHYLFAGYFNQILLSSMGGDAMRALWLKRRDMKLLHAVVAIFIERVLAVYTLIVIATIAASLVSDFKYRNTGICLGVLISIGLPVGLWGMVRWELFRVQWFSGWRREVAIFTRKLIANGHMPRVVAWTFIYQIATILASYFVALAIGVNNSEREIFLVVPLVWLATMVPISLGGIGVREVAFIFLFALVGVPGESALVISLGTYLVFLFWGLVGGVWYTLAGHVRDFEN